jgi:hypothetical protein
MIKIQPVVRDLVMNEIEAYTALTNDYMNMSSYAYRIRPTVEALTKKKVTIASLVVTISRLKKEFKKGKPLVPKVPITNITTKLPLTELVYENTPALVEKLQMLHKKISVGSGDFFTATIGTAEIDIIFSSKMTDTILKHFIVKPKIINHNLAAVGISYGPEVFGTPNIFFALLYTTARARINIEELVSTSTEFIFIIAEKDFAKTVALFSQTNI